MGILWDWGVFCFLFLAVVPAWPHLGKSLSPYSGAKIGAYTTHTVKCNFKMALLRMMQSNFRAYSCILMLVVAMYALPHYLYLVIFLMNICLCNFTLIHYFNFDTFFGAGVHQFVMILNKPPPCCCGLWIISVVSVGYLDILVCSHLMTFSLALATFMLWRIVQINMAKLAQVYAKVRRGEIKDKREEKSEVNLLACGRTLTFLYYAG